MHLLFAWNPEHHCCGTRSAWYATVEEANIPRTVVVDGQTGERAICYDQQPGDLWHTGGYGDTIIIDKPQP